MISSKAGSKPKTSWSLVLRKKTANVKKNKTTKITLEWSDKGCNDKEVKITGSILKKQAVFQGSFDN